MSYVSLRREIVLTAREMFNQGLVRGPGAM